MTFRTIGTFAFAIALLAAGAAYSPEARAITVQAIEYDLTVTYIPGNPVFPNLTGGAGFSVPGEGGINLVIGGFDIGTLIPGNPVFTGRFIPSDPIIPGNPISPVSFSFGGTSGGFPAFAFPGNVDLATLVAVVGPPILPLPIFDLVGPPIRVSGLIVGFDAPGVVGTWDITIQAATPLPAALPLFATGLGVMGFLAKRRKRKSAAAVAAA